MTDNKNIGDQLKAETWSRVSKLSHNKLKTNKHVKRRKQSQSPSLDGSVYYRKESESPKLSRIRFNGCNSGDSPSEADALQEIIWDPASPPPLMNGKGAGKSVRRVEISDIVNRIAPKDEKPVDKDLVLQWIGDSAIPCTPEHQHPWVRRPSARRQSNNVEDLMKLAKQFDINMTRQDEERDLEIRQSSKAKNNGDLAKLIKTLPSNPESQSKGTSPGALTPVSVKPKWLSHEEELHALFDGPTQHLSGKLSPPSASCTQESIPAPVSLSTKRPSSADSTAMPKHPAEVPKPDFEDDWENDDLLNDSFLLEVTQNPEVLASAPRQSIGRVVYEASRKCETATITSSLGPCSRAGSTPQLHRGSGTGTFSKTQYHDPSIPRPGPKTSVQTGSVRTPTKPSPEPAQSAEPETYRSRAQICPFSRNQTVMTVRGSVRETEGSGSPEAKASDTSAGASEKNHEVDADTLWGDGNGDDDLLYQACDDVERISASQEQQEWGVCADLVSIKSTSSPSKAPLSVDTTNSSSISRASLQSQSAKHGQPVSVLARSYSIPGATSALENKQDSVGAGPQSGEPGRYRFMPVKHASGVAFSAQQPTGVWREARSHGPSSENSTSRHSTFKRHQSDPVALTNKVFTTVRAVARCSAAEIERKKQEALARRRSRLQASEKPGSGV